MERKIERVKKRREINLDQESPANNFERSARLEFLLERYQFGLQNTLRISREPLVVVSPSGNMEQHPREESTRARVRPSSAWPRFLSSRPRL